VGYTRLPYKVVMGLPDAGPENYIHSGYSCRKQYSNVWCTWSITLGFKKLTCYSFLWKMPVDVLVLKHLIPLPIIHSVRAYWEV